MMEESIGKYLKHIILCDNKPVGCVSCIKLENGIYEDWEKLTLVTPIDKKENGKNYNVLMI